MIRRVRRYRPFDHSGRGMVAAIFLTFGLISALTVTLSIRAIDHSRNGATVVEVVGRQRTLAERYVSEVQLVQSGLQADPAAIGGALAQSARALLNGGAVPAVNGDDDAATIPAATGSAVRAQLAQQVRLVNDLRVIGAAVLSDQRTLSGVKVSAGENVRGLAPVQALRVVAALTSNVALNAARTIAAQSDGNVANLTTVQIVLGAVGLVVSLLLAWGLVATTRSQNAHYRSLVTSSSDLVFVLGDSGCLYVSRSLCRVVGRGENELLGDGLAEFIHEYDLDKLGEALGADVPATMLLRVRNAAGELRYLEAHLTDLRHDRHLRGVVISSRDVTERVRLEEELLLQSQRDAFGTQIIEALEMADDEHTAYDVVERAMAEISPESPMELLLSDSSRAHLTSAAASPSAGAPGCPVESPFACVAVRRGQPVEFESSEALNACPKLRGRETGPCSAICVPVSFMGRALGVLHATGPEGALEGGERLQQLTTLATQAGARIGTVRAFEKTQLQAATDGLTGLVNRRTFEREVRDLIAQQRPFALAVADLDHFKKINDTYGHDAGDGALRMFSQVTQDALRDGDILGRWGGEEFVLALPGVDREQAVSVLDRIRSKLAAVTTGEHPRFTVSFGVTDSTVGNTLEQMMLVADAALYDSKEAGRDRVTIGPPKNGGGARNGRANGKPALHVAVDEEEPRPTGLEIR